VQTSDSRFSFISRHLQLLLSRREREVGEKETSCKFPQLYCSFLYQITKFAARDVLTPPLSRRLGVSFYWGFVQLVPVENERNLCFYCSGVQIEEVVSSFLVYQEVRN
jgi:hypothetical protein